LHEPPLKDNQKILLHIIFRHGVVRFSGSKPQRIANDDSMELNIRRKCVKLTEKTEFTQASASPSISLLYVF